MLLLLMLRALTSRRRSSRASPSRLAGLSGLLPASISSFPLVLPASDRGVVEGDGGVTPFCSRMVDAALISGDVALVVVVVAAAAAAALNNPSMLAAVVDSFSFFSACCARYCARK